MPKKILVIDDSEDMVTLQRTVLEMEGHLVATALGGREALEILKQDPKFDLILLDVNMKDMDGPEFLEMFEKEMPSIMKATPVVLMTGMDNPPQTKAVGTINKILGLDEFLESVRKYL